MCALCVCFNSLKLECDKITNEKGEMHRHYIMVSVFLLSCVLYLCPEGYILCCYSKALLQLEKCQAKGFSLLSLLGTEVVSHKRAITCLLYIFMNILTSS